MTRFPKENVDHATNTIFQSTSEPINMCLLKVAPILFSMEERNEESFYQTINITFFAFFPYFSFHFMLTSQFKKTAHFPPQLHLLHRSFNIPFFVSDKVYAFLSPFLDLLQMSRKWGKFSLATIAPGLMLS